MENLIVQNVWMKKKRYLCFQVAKTFVHLDIKAIVQWSV